MALCTSDVTVSEQLRPPTTQFTVCAEQLLVPLHTRLDWVRVPLLQVTFTLPMAGPVASDTVSEAVLANVPTLPVQLLAPTLQLTVCAAHWA